jgi:hypothetical protein
MFPAALLMDAMHGRCAQALHPAARPRTIGGFLGRDNVRTLRCHEYTTTH